MNNKYESNLRYIKSAAFVVAFCMLCMVISVSTAYASEDKNMAPGTADCIVDKDGNATYTAWFSTIPVTDDGVLYLYALAPYEYGISDRSEVIAFSSQNENAIAVFKFPVNHLKENTRLYSKFAIGIKSAGAIKMITQPVYITNPEALASHTLPRCPRTKKSTQGEDFNNLFLDGTYGKELGWIYKTIQVLNTGKCEALTHPMSRSSARSNDSHRVNDRYYMLNASDDEGIRAISDQLRYYVLNSRGGENWIIGNEVNTREWNYMAWTDWNEYIREYAQGFRIAYNTIKSINANARIFVSVDQFWDMNTDVSDKKYYSVMDGRDFLTEFARLIKSEGDIDWGLSQHPYPAPLSNAKFWDMSGVRKGAEYERYVKNGQLVTFQNLSVLTDFMRTSAMLKPDGSIRHIILSELGLTNAQGIEVQAAALCASYRAILDNPYIDEAIYLNEYSEPGIDTRLSGFSGEVYENMDGENADKYFEWAKNYIGISDWSELLW